MKRGNIIKLAAAVIVVAHAVIFSVSTTYGFRKRDSFGDLISRRCSFGFAGSAWFRLERQYEGIRIKQYLSSNSVSTLGSFRTIFQVDFVKKRIVVEWQGSAILRKLYYIKYNRKIDIQRILREIF
jgi:hypothetical protein